MSEPVLKIENLTKRFGGFVALDGVDLAVFPGERLGLIGPNGSGKSTLVNCITGVLRHEHGSIRFDGHDLAGLQPHSRTRLGLARSFQIPKPFASMSVLDNLLVPLFYAAHAHDHKARHAGEAAEEAREILRQLGLADKAEQTSATLTQAEMRKLELARAIAARPKLLIADEAMAGLSSTEVDEILDILIDMKARGIAVIMIEHIMRAMMRFSERVAVLVVGRKIADGDPEAVMCNPEVEKAYLGE